MDANLTADDVRPVEETHLGSKLDGCSASTAEVRLLGYGKEITVMTMLLKVQSWDKIASTVRDCCDQSFPSVSRFRGYELVHSSLDIAELAMLTHVDTDPLFRNEDPEVQRRLSQEATEARDKALATYLSMATRRTRNMGMKRGREEGDDGEGKDAVDRQDGLTIIPYTKKT